LILDETTKKSFQIRKKKFILHGFVKGNNLHQDRLDMMDQDNIPVHMVDIDDELDHLNKNEENFIA